MAHVATGGKKWLKKPKSERNDIELLSFHYWTRLDVAARLILSQLVAILATYFEIRSSNLFCPSELYKA